MVALGVLLGVVALVLPFVASSRATGARRLARGAQEQAARRVTRVDALKDAVLELRAAVRAQAGR